MGSELMDDGAEVVADRSSDRYRCAAISAAVGNSSAAASTSRSRSVRGLMPSAIEDAARPRIDYSSVGIDLPDCFAGITFGDAGDYELEGVPDRWHLYRLVS